MSRLGKRARKNKKNFNKWKAFMSFPWIYLSESIHHRLIFSKLVARIIFFFAPRVYIWWKWKQIFHVDIIMQHIKFAFRRCLRVKREQEEHVNVLKAHYCSFRGEEYFVGRL